LLGGLWSFWHFFSRLIVWGGSILDTADEKPVPAVVGVAVHFIVVAEQVPLPGGRRAILSRRPKVGAVAQKVEAPIVVLMASGNGIASAVVGGLIVANTTCF